MKILVTGAAGFIGYHLTQALLARGDEVLGIDNLNDYYDVALKEARLQQLEKKPDFTFLKRDITDREAMAELFESYDFTHVAHLAAQAGVRYSITNPYAYVDTNLVGFGNMLENCRQKKIKHCVYASSSSVYGANQSYPFKEADGVNHPVALYAATKRANELMAHSYAHLYRLPCTGLRFFTVYGPWGRPDMALFKFTKNIIEDRPIDVYNHGNMARDFTYVDDIVEGIIRVIDHPAEPAPAWSGNNPPPATSNAPYRVYNIGRGKPVALLDFINILEKQLDKTAQKNNLPLQAGDVPETYADTSALENDLGYKPSTSPEEGIAAFVNWYQAYYSK